MNAIMLQAIPGLSWGARMLVALGFAIAAVHAADPPAANAVLRVVRPAKADPVDFARDVLPLLQGNCLPCHNRTTSKADLLLETPRRHAPRRRVRARAGPRQGVRVVAVPHVHP